jgi:trigger factor
MPDDHTDERLAGKEVTFTANILSMQARELPEWEELPTLEEFEGTLEELREKTRNELVESAKTHAERESADEYVKQLLETSTFDIPEALVEREADLMLKQQEQEYARYGVKPEQVYAYRGQNRDDLVQELLPRAEERIKRSMAMQLVIEAEGLSVTDEEIEAQIEENIGEGDEEQKAGMRTMLSTQFRSMMADAALDKKLREHMLLLAAGQAPSQIETQVIETQVEG